MGQVDDVTHERPVVKPVGLLVFDIYFPANVIWTPPPPSRTPQSILNIALYYLQPGCMYRVRVKNGESNPHIERASPSFIDIQVSLCDISRALNFFQ